jgi:hypothetical protein
VAGALALAAAPQAWSQSDDLAALKAQLEGLQAKVQELEKQQKSQQETQDKTTDMVAQARSSTPEWASRFTWKGDLRYRHENVDAEEAVSDQTRHRVRARFGFAARVNDNITGTVQLSTTGGLNTSTNQTDTRSTNQTLGNGFDRKDIGLDLAYLDWKAAEGFNLMAGKMPQPFAKTGSFFFDNDITPEGLAAKFARGPFFGSAFGFWLSERSTARDATLLGAQIGLTGNVGSARLTGAIGYYDVGSVQGEITTFRAASGTTPQCSSNTAFFGGSLGNTTVSDADGCSHLLNDFDMIHALVQAEMKVGSQPLTLFGDYIQNQEADDLDKGYALGFTLGKASNAHTWEIGYVWQKTEKDAQFGQFEDSDFGGGLTDVNGMAFKIGYALAKNWVLNGTYFRNKRFIDAVGATESDYDRYQVDLNLKF